MLYRVVAMATDSIENGGEITELSFRLIGGFHHLQMFIDERVATKFFEKQIPEVADIIRRKMISRIKDEERADLFVAISRQLGTDAELEHFGTTFRQVKKMRDSLAHSAVVEAISDDQLSVVKSYIDPAMGIEPRGSRIHRDAIEAAIHKCKWLEMQALYVSGYGLGEEIGMGVVPIRFRKPPADPHAWDGSVIQWPGRSSGV